jgi:hypothetical protein
MAILDLVKMARRDRESFAAHLPVTDHWVFEEKVLPSGWYPEVIFRDLMLAYDRVRGRGDLTSLVAMGRLAAKLAMTGVYHSYRELSPSDGAARSGVLWPQYHSTGVIRVIASGTCRTVLALEGFGLPSEAMCRMNDGYLAGQIEHAGARGVRIEHATCAAKGADRCEFSATWAATLAPLPSGG